MSAPVDTSPEGILSLTRPADGFLCPIDANTYGITFLAFSIQDYETKRVLFEVGEGVPEGESKESEGIAWQEEDNPSLDALRSIRYDFNVDVLRLPTISTHLTFAVGPTPVPKFRMIERHYFRNTLVKSYDFEFGFCIPNSTNTWEAVYDMPPLEDALVEAMVAHPYETTSDSFYFAGGKLIMHNKASYRYYVDSSTTTSAKVLAAGGGLGGSDAEESKM